MEMGKRTDNAEGCKDSKTGTATMPYTTLIPPLEADRLLRERTAQVLICDCRHDLADHGAGARAYAEGHIPSAVFVAMEHDLSAAKTGRNGRHPLPAREQFARRMAELGVGDATQVVAYDAGGGMYAARLWWMLRWVGHEAVAVLDGGLAAWRAAGLPLSDEPPAPRSAGPLTLRAPLVAAVDYAAVRANVDGGDRLVIDARAADRFRGENETMDPVAGHIPGARNRPFAANLGADGRFKPADELRREFQALLGGTPPERAVAQCGSGVTACHNLLAMEVAGLPGAALYPGSWSEWCAQPGAPVATGQD